jgi:hypothetical protein|tara:strand:- start:288 stop:431 length:144 start_codon:yes stop_codon:yes gene_type:complete
MKNDLKHIVISKYNYDKLLADLDKRKKLLEKIEKQLQLINQEIDVAL